MSVRPIEFRGKDSASGEWRYGAYIPPEYTKWQAASIFDGCYRKEIDQDTLGLYTGYKDMHGTKIYEGDILEDLGNRYGRSSPCRMIVCFGEWDAGCMTKCKFYGFYVKGYDVRIKIWWYGNFVEWTMLPDVRVVGNIHDNADLLLEVNE